MTNTFERLSKSSNSALITSLEKFTVETRTYRFDNRATLLIYLDVKEEFLEELNYQKSLPIDNQPEDERSKILELKL